MKKITVFLCDDHAIFREGLRLLLEATGEIDVIGEAGNGHDSVSKTKRLQPDVVLMDVVMPLLNGVEATRKIKREVPATRVLIVSTYSDEQHVQQAMEAGAVGYLMKETASKDLLCAIREACKGNGFFSPPIAKHLLRQLRNRDPQSNNTAGSALTSRQTEVVQLIAEGHSSKEMAALLVVSVKTVEKHRQAVMDKLDIHEIAGLTRYAVSRGLVECRPTPDMPAMAEQMAGRPASNGDETYRSPNGINSRLKASRVA